MVGNERLCAIETCSGLKRSPLQAGLARTARSVGQHLTNLATRETKLIESV